MINNVVNLFIKEKLSPKTFFSFLKLFVIYSERMLSRLILDLLPRIVGRFSIKFRNGKFDIKIMHNQMN